MIPNQAFYQAELHPENGGKGWIRTNDTCCFRALLYRAELPHQKMAGTEGVEPTTYGFGDRRSTN